MLASQLGEPKWESQILHYDCNFVVYLSLQMLAGSLCGRSSSGSERETRRTACAGRFSNLPSPSPREHEHHRASSLQFATV